MERLVELSPSFYNSFIYPKIVIIDDHTVKVNYNDLGKYITDNIKIIISYGNKKIIIKNPAMGEILILNEPTDIVSGSGE